VKRKGPIANSCGQPSREFYKCSVKDCNVTLRGDGIGTHFQKKANLLALDTATEYQSKLAKSLTPKTIIEKSVEYLKSLLWKNSESEKLHTLHLFHHGHTSLALPNCDSITFKCQQKKYTVGMPNLFKNSGFTFFGKKPKLAQKDDISEANSQEVVQDSVVESNSEIISLEPENLIADTNDGIQAKSIPANAEKLEDILNKNQSQVELTKEHGTEKNPWNVESVQEFSFLNCPECSFKTKSSKLFCDHAVENHPLSKVLLDSKSDYDKSMIGVVKNEEILKSLISPEFMEQFANRFVETLAEVILIFFKYFLPIEKF
jgi:hypothetical protein